MKQTLTSVTVVGSLLTLMTGCVAYRAVTGYFAHANPPRLAGTWVDSSLATPTDTVAWVLGERGLDQTLTIHVGGDAPGGRSERLEGYGYWYVAGDAPPADTGRICFRSRARGRDACFDYRVSTLPPDAAGRARRRLLIVAYQGRRHTRDRILIER